VVLIPMTGKPSLYPGLFIFTTPCRMVRPVKNLLYGRKEWIGTLEQAGFAYFSYKVLTVRAVSCIRSSILWSVCQRSWEWDMGNLCWRAGIGGRIFSLLANEFLIPFLEVDERSLFQVLKSAFSINIVKVSLGEWSLSHHFFMSRSANCRWAAK